MPGVGGIRFRSGGLFGSAAHGDLENPEAVGLGRLWTPTFQFPQATLYDVPHVLPTLTDVEFLGV